MTIQSVVRSINARKQLLNMYRQNINNNYKIDDLLHNELRFINDNPTRSLTRRWLAERFPYMTW